MRELITKTARIFFLLFALVFVASCDQGCVEADEFDAEYVTIESNPIDDGVEGTYNHQDGGQKANWHDTKLKSNGDEFLILVSGSWTPWNGASLNDDSLALLPFCFNCAKGPTSANCICYRNQTSRSESAISGNPDCIIRGWTPSSHTECVDQVEVSGLGTRTMDCSQPENAADPEKCSCEPGATLDSASDYGVYHFPRNYFEKNGDAKIADRQIACRFNRGTGAYVALFGKEGVETPKRAYHLFSETEVCGVVRDSQGRCLNAEGKDMTRYSFKSANSRIFMKDDKNGNDGTDTDTSDDEYHSPNEVVKVIIYDSYYSDNSGRYNLTFLRGVGPKGSSSAQNGLLEFLVSMVEDVLLGEIDASGERSGGVLEFLYNAIVRDSGFAMGVQIVLSLYICFYGLAYIMGVADINKQEVMKRLVKIALVIFFVSPDSWFYYKKIVVGFFKDSIDYLVAMIMDISDNNIQATSEIEIAKMDRQNDQSNATRFSYVDLIIKKMLSKGTAKKVFGLFFTEIFGFLYIPGVYALIAGFIYVMLLVATTYLINLVRLIFVLSLGPIFICFTLFSKTQSMFRNWVGFLAGTGFEIIVMFTILYNFLTLINQSFTDLLAYRACVEVVNLGFFSIKILKSYSSHSLADWAFGLIVTGALIFITKMIIDQVGGLASGLFKLSVDGGGAGGGMFGSFGAAQSARDHKKGSGEDGVFTAASGFTKSVLNKAFMPVKAAGSYGMQGATAIARKSGIAEKWNNLGKALPFRGIRSRKRDALIDKIINVAEKKIGGGPSLARDKQVRDEVLKMAQHEIMANPNKAALYGVDTTTILRRLNKKAENKLAKYMESKAKSMKESGAGSIQFGKDARDSLNKATKDWALANLGMTEKQVDDFLAKSSTKRKAKSEATLSSSEAAEKFAGNRDLENKYLQYLKAQEEERHDKKAQAKWYQKPGIMMSRGYHNLRQDSEHNPRSMQKAFVRKAQNKKQGNWANPLNKSGVVDQYSTMIGGRAISGAKNLKNWVANKFKIGDRSDRATDVKPGYLARRRQEQLEATKAMLEKPFTPGDARQERSRDFYHDQMQRQLVRDSGVGKDLDAIRKMEKKGKSQSDIQEAKDKLMEKISDPSLGAYERSSLLSYVHRQLGLDAARDPQKLAASRMEEKVRAAANPAQPRSVKQAEKAKADLERFQKGLLSKEAGPSQESIREVEDALRGGKVPRVPEEKLQLGAEESSLSKAMAEAKDKLDKEIDERKKEEAAKAIKEREQQAASSAAAVLSSTTDEAARKEALGQLVGEFKGGAKEHIDSAQRVGDRLDRITAELDAVISDRSKTDAQKQEAIANANSQVEALGRAEGVVVTPPSTGLVASKMEFDLLKASAADALIKAPEFGLVAGNPFLTAGQEKGEIDSAALAALNSEVMQLSAKRKMSVLNKRILEFKIEEAKKSNNLIEQDKLQRELDEIEQDIAVCERGIENKNKLTEMVKAGGA